MSNNEKSAAIPRLKQEGNDLFALVSIISWECATGIEKCYVVGVISVNYIVSM